MIAKAEFDLFIAEKGNACPHNDIRRTRNGQCPQWFILVASRPQSSFRRNGISPLPTSSLSNPMIQAMTVKGQGFPLPCDCNEIAFVLECWGTGVNGPWAQQVLDLLCEFLREGGHLHKKDLCCECIVLLFKLKIECVFMHCFVVDAAINGFHNNFDRIYEEEGGDFFSVAVAAIHCADALIHFNTPPPVENNVVEESDDEPNIVKSVCRGVLS